MYKKNIEKDTIILLLKTQFKKNKANTCVAMFKQRTPLF